jgi:uncharacterized coiled-coil protein SlyX
MAQAVAPAPDGGYPGFNTAAGQNALFSLTTGIGNTGVGWFSLKSNTEGNFNTAVGAGTLLLNVGDQSTGDGTRNTATGAGALLSNTTGAANTANGAFALFSNTTGESNTANGNAALNHNTEGSSNTATGSGALADNTTGRYNTANGTSALLGNTTGSFNTGVGAGTLLFNGTGENNTATGYVALYGNTTGSNNTATGYSALLANSGDNNTATGFEALISNVTGGLNTATGLRALYSNTTGGSNTADGDLALYSNTSGTGNVALGSAAGFNATTGNFNVYIGQGMEGVADESGHTYIRNINTTSVSGGGADYVTVDLTTGLLGHASSSRRYKEEIKPMDDASEALFALKPVTFRYKKDIDKSQSLQYGLVAEDVAQVDPDLAIRDGNGQIENVRYSAVNAMLLNEFLKEHKKVEEQQLCITELNSRVGKQERIIAQQQQGMEALTAQIKQQASQIQKVSTQLEMNKLAGRGRTAGRIRRGGPVAQIAGTISH